VRNKRHYTFTLTEEEKNVLRGLSAASAVTQSGIMGWLILNYGRALSDSDIDSLMGDRLQKNKRL